MAERLRIIITINATYNMQTSDFDYNLPKELIAQTPAEPRDSSRLMVVDRYKKTVEHRQFFNILEYLKPGDLLVWNNTKVFKARLRSAFSDSNFRGILLCPFIREKAQESKKACSSKS